MKKTKYKARGNYKIFTKGVARAKGFPTARSLSLLLTSTGGNEARDRTPQRTPFVTYGILAILLLTFLGIVPKPTLAQGVDVGIYPPIIQITTTPPATPRANFFIQNNSDDPLDLNIILKPFTSSDLENGQVSFDTNQTFDDPNFLQKVQIFDASTPVTSVYLGPKEKKDLSMQIDIPKGEPLSDYYFSLLFVSKTGDFSNVNLSQVSAAIGTNVLLSIGPKGKNQGEIQQFSSPFFINSGPVPFTVRVKNTSSHFLTVKGQILITNLFGQTIGKITLLPSNILSNTSRRITDNLQAPGKENDFAKIQTVVLDNKYPVAVWPEKYLFGPYTATLTIALTDQGPTLTKQIHFFAFPLEALISLIIIILVILFIILRVKRKLPEFQS